MSAAILTTARKLSASPRRDAPGLFHIPPSAHTLDGFRAWIETLPEKTKVTFLGGEVYLDMSKEDIETHTKVKGELFAVLYQLVRAADFGQIFQDGVLLTNADAELSTNPDAVAIRWETLQSGKSRIVERNGKHLELEGTPDWVLEVVSPSSVVKDTQFLKTAYHAAGIPEYWLVDARGPEIAFSIFTYRAAGYAAVRPTRGFHASPVFGQSFRLCRTRDRLGMWQYELQMRGGR